MRTALSTFKSSYHWTVYGSILYEAIRILHYSLLFSHLGAFYFGSITVLVASINLLERLSDGGIAYTFGIFKHEYFLSQQRVKIFFYLYTFPQIFLFLGITLIVALWRLNTQPGGMYPLPLPFLLFYGPFSVFLHVATSQARMLLYVLGSTKETVTYELSSYALLVSFFWISIYSFDFVSLPEICIWYLFMILLYQIVLIILFLRLLTSWYRSLTPILSEQDVNTSWDINKFTRISKARLLQWALRMGRSWFTSIWLTPFFAYYYGLYYAGLYAFSNKVVQVVMGSIKSLIYFNGNPLLSSLAHESSFKKRRLFYSLAQRVIRLFVLGSGLITVFLLYSDASYCYLLPTLLCNSFLESYFLLYEQLYCAQERAGFYFFIKGIEALIVGLLFSYASVSAQEILMIMICMQLASLALIAYSAWRRWKIVPALSPI